MAAKVTVVYVAGPFRCASAYQPGQQDAFGIHLNVTRAMALALEVWRAGAAAICPHANSFCYQGSAPDDVWLRGDLAILERCDAVLMTPDWERSSGARAEEAHAKSIGLPVFYVLDDLVAWLRLRPAA